jgi:hypothetical protein
LQGQSLFRLSVVAIVLLVATTNVMGLMNARGLGRLQDVFVRRAL